jgi:hypothetical protein
MAAVLICPVGAVFIKRAAAKTAVAHLPHPGKSPQFTSLSCTQTAPGEGEMGTYTLLYPTTVIPAKAGIQNFRLGEDRCPTLHSGFPPARE